MAKTQREASRENWNLNSDQGPTIDEINSGSLQRIADATEAMAKNHIRLQQDYDYMKGSRDRYRTELTAAENKIRTLKGVITKLKKKANPANA